MQMSQINEGDTAWVLCSSALVMIMTPGLGFFYGGMVRKKNLLSTIGYCFIIFAVVSIVWYLIAFSLAFAPSAQQNGFLGNLDFACMENMALGVVNTKYSSTIPFALLFFFQLKFAGITPALILGSIVERIKLVPLIIFTIIWLIVVYCPIAHWMWNPEGWANKWGILDFAGGNVVHISAGAAGLAAAILIRRKDEEKAPCSISLTLLGTSLLWFGWFGFNGGSSFGANYLAVSACISTNMAASMAGLTWIFLQRLHGGQASILGFACGSVCGLVAITPACGFVEIWASIIIGMSASICSYFFCHYKDFFFKKQVDDTLDVFGCHGISGLWGGFATGLFAHNRVNPLAGFNRDGAFYGNGKLLGKQICGMLASLGWSFVLTLIIIFILKKTIGMTVDESQQQKGLDLAVHNEENDPIMNQDEEEQQQVNVNSEKIMINGNIVQQINKGVELKNILINQEFGTENGKDNILQLENIGNDLEKVNDINSRNQSHKRQDLDKHIDFNS